MNVLPVYIGYNLASDKYLCKTSVLISQQRGESITHGAARPKINRGRYQIWGIRAKEIKYNEIIFLLFHLPQNRIHLKWGEMFAR